MAKINSKQKGNRGERELVDILNSRFNCKAFKRCPSSGAYVGGSNRQLNEGLSEEAKITLASDIICPKDFSFVIEHKNYQKIEFWDLFNEKSELKSWMLQVEGDAKFVGKKPLLVVKTNYHERICFVKDNFDGFIFQYKDWYCGWLTDILKKENAFFGVKNES